MGALAGGGRGPWGHTMGHRRSKERVQAAHSWATFVARNREQILAAGLPDFVMQSIDRWDDFLLHGCRDHHGDPSGFTIDQLSEQQYGALFQLVESYFVSGYEFYEPSVLRSEDQGRLKHRFG